MELTDMDAQKIWNQAIQVCCDRETEAAWKLTVFIIYS